LELSEKNQLVAAGYQQAKNPAPRDNSLPTESDIIAVEFMRRKTLPSQIKLMEKVEQWKLSVQTQVRASKSQKLTL
jgi:hypothetical protein